MALFRGIQEYIALDANNITLVFDSGNIVNISGNIFLYPPQGHPILYNYYKHIKTTFGYEQYLDKIVNPKLRSVLTKLRISAHNLRVETGRYCRNMLERNERKCLLCANSNDIEDINILLYCVMYVMTCELNICHPISM